MISITLAEEAAAPWARLKQYSVTARIGRAVGNAVLNYMDVNTRANHPRDSFFSGSLDNFFQREIKPGGLLAMQQGSRNPDFVRYLDAKLRSYRHDMNPPSQFYTKYG
jgi:hypothetical protein